ncbi:uncharacterized protein L199_000486 [Kwoniella botswanensis]|uniref:uncharacterized protein n=1 Tax=Kwoniella botswanensis TaxID=1268659 RepID=UPI00315DDB85
MATLVKEREVAHCQTNRGVLEAIKRSREVGVSDDELEGESSQETQLYGPSIRGPPPSKFAPYLPEDPALQVLHQLCAFEQVLQEVIAEKDGLKVSPIKASLRVELDFEEIIKPFLVKGDVRVASDHFNQCYQETADWSIWLNSTETQLKKKDNIVPEHWLKLIEKSFLSFLSIGSLHLQSSLHLKDLHFVVFSFPEEIDDIPEAGSEEGLTFEHEVDGREITLIGLGPARTINHSCEPNVYWELETETLDYLPDGSLPNIGFTCLPIDRVEEKFINRGQQLTAFYSDYIAENLCSHTSAISNSDCKYPTYHQQGKRADSGSDSEYEPEDSDDETKPAFVRSKTESQMEVKRRSPRLPAYKKVAGDSARTTQVILPHKATRVTGKLISNDICSAGKPPAIQPSLPSMHPMKQLSSPVKRKLPSDEFTMANSDQQKPKASKAETTNLDSIHKQANEQSSKPAVQEDDSKKCDLTRSSLSFHQTSPPSTTQNSHLPESNSTKISPLRDAFDLFSNISEEQYPITSTSIPMSNATPLLQAFLNSQQIVINQQELFNAQLANPKVTEAMIRKTQDMLARYQDTQDRLCKMLWGERLN